MSDPRIVTRTTRVGNTQRTYKAKTKKNTPRTTEKVRDSPARKAWLEDDVQEQIERKKREEAEMKERQLKEKEEKPHHDDDESIHNYSSKEEWVKIMAQMEEDKKRQEDEITRKQQEAELKKKTRRSLTETERKTRAREKGTRGIRKKKKIANRTDSTISWNSRTTKQTIKQRTKNH